MDFIIALLIFTFTLAAYISYTNNFQKQGKGDLDDLLKDSKAISSSLVLSGYPSDWDSTNAIRIGIADDQRVNSTKIAFFKQLKYNETKKKFATAYDYFIFFTNDKGAVLNINGTCGIGNPAVDASYVGGACMPINITNINPKKLVNT